MKTINIDGWTIKDAYNHFFQLKSNPKRLNVSLMELVKNTTEVQCKKKLTIPTDCWPLYSNQFRIFSDGMCMECTDPEILKIVDNIPAQMGYCYRNAELLAHALQNRGYPAKIYAGWMFNSPTELPIHHAWVVLDDYLFDLSYEKTIVDANRHILSQAKSNDELREMFQAMRMEMVQQGVKNTQRCRPVGNPEGYYYIGCEIPDAETGRNIWRMLKRRYPIHASDTNPSHEF